MWRAYQTLGLFHFLGTPDKSPADLLVHHLPQMGPQSQASRAASPTWAVFLTQDLEITTMNLACIINSKYLISINLKMAITTG